MCSAMGQEKPRRSIPSASCPLDGVVKYAGFWPAVADHLVVLDDQVDVILTGSPEPLFQPQTVAASFHMAASGASDNFRILQQFVEEDRIV
jgi:hypothetical protein